MHIHWGKVAAVVEFALGLLLWVIFIFGPMAVLRVAHPLVGVTAAAASLCVFVATYRWRNGYAMLPGCLGLALIFHNTAVICLGFALVTRLRDYAAWAQLAAGLCGIPFTILLVKSCEKLLNHLLGPAGRANADEP